MSQSSNEPGTFAARKNALGQETGFPVPGWTARPRPPRTAIEGRFCRIEPVDPERHAADLFEANSDDAEGRNWTYLPYGPFAEPAGYRRWLEATCQGDDPLFHAIVERAGGRAVGLASLMRIEPAVGVIEVGHINYSPRLQGRAAATEAMYLLMRRVFDELGYRRYEWKCDALNGPSMRAAERLGFRYEGTFRQATMYKGRNRDTAWYSILDREWPALRQAFERWLDPANFDGDGGQLSSLSALTRAAAADRATAGS
ncbi:GNAT family N-acetyltransferase [Oceanibacterium hippocampi]|uniref:Putative ribosomal N-acetyltransferase YdaF n=1 Tax=Oceanibacterium hippocampi TaxID=745714 RepID=A0A1Y5T4Q4_9PROT|nr:GNAT family protein [Oceanibacterium hippocampi]SLN55193.1 Putative ribosomal N-acetyltransferase YdaF [Oceanibacterium hippocampi]